MVYCEVELYSITQIYKVNKIHHLQNFTIHLDEKESKHLIITGKDGSGKTVLLNEILQFLIIS